MSYTLKATAGQHPLGRPSDLDLHRIFSSRPPLLLNALRAPTNSWKSTVPLPLHELVMLTMGRVV